MSKTVREIAKVMGVDDANLVKEKQRIRDEFKRQKIKPKKDGNRFVVTDKEADKIIAALKEATPYKNTPTRKIHGLKDQLEILEAKYKKLEGRNKKLEEDNKELEGKNKELKDTNEELEGSKKDQSEEIQRLHSKIEKYADDFKELNDKQLQLNNQQQVLQARILEQTKQLKDTQAKLLESAEIKDKLQDKVNKVEKASLWQRITKKFD